MKASQKPLLGLVLLAGVAGLSLMITPKASAAGLNYTPANLMSQEVFTNSSSMSQASIQGFLVAEGSGLANYSQVSNCYNVYMKYNCGQNESAAEIIAEAANSYGINPQVILSTLQKEQSLITTPNPTSSQLAHAMGYGCPDSGGCDSQYYGFFNQVDWAAWQFAYDTAASSGNSFQGTTASSYPCQNSSQYYSGGLLPGNTVSFIDDGGTKYRTLTLANAPTAALYCYTPHTYNNPQGLYNLPSWGTTGDYYSGSYWFAQSFNTWFGFYANAFAGQSAYPALDPGQSTTVFLEYKNTGNEPWYDDSSIGSAPVGGYPTHLATDNPINRCSIFASSGWPGCSRPATNFSAVYESDGTTAAPSQHIVQPGEIAKFSFTITAPSGTAAGFYKEAFRPILEGTGSGGMNDPGTWLGITINPVSNVSYVSQSSYMTILPGESGTATIKFKNSGSLPLYDSTSISSSPTGTYPLHLATTDPLNSPSDFSSGWPSSDRPAINFSTVYNSNGTNPASNQHIAQPGQIIKFSFPVSAPVAYTAGSFNLHVQPVLEGASSQFPDSGIYWTITIPSTPVLAITNNTPKLQLTSNEPGQIELAVKNIGNSTADTNTEVTTGSNSPYQAPGWQSNGIVETLSTGLAPNDSTSITLPVLAPTLSNSLNSSFSCGFSDNGQVLPITSACTTSISVSPYSYAAKYYGESTYPTLVPGGQATMYFEYKNAGNQPWYDDNSLPSATWRNAKPTHLATSNPMNRVSQFSSTWPSGNRPDLNFSAVYEADGTTLAPDQHIVQPGEIAKFSFTVQAPMNQAPATYHEYFEPVIEGTSGLINNAGTWEPITVLAPSYTDAYAGQSSYPSIPQGSQAAVYLMYKNTGNEPWYDGTSLSSAPTDTYPVHLATSNPMNRVSQFSSTWPSGNRPDLNFSAVYEADGTTLAPDQHIVQPGEIAKFRFTMTVSGSTSAGFYREYFQPILEGTPGTLNDVGTWLGITVTPS